MDRSRLADLATRYAAAWSSRNPASLAAFYAENGSLSVNGGAPAVGRAAVTAKVGDFMSAFPDMVVKMDAVSRDGDIVLFHWTWTGTNTGPGGTGRAVRISGCEAWTLTADGQILESSGSYDETEYQRQMSGAPMRPVNVTDTRRRFAELKSRANVSLGCFDRASIGIGRYVPGASPWERHANGDELLLVLDGSVDIEVLDEDRPSRSTLAEGSLFVVPRGHWHQLLAETPVTILYLSPPEDGAERTRDHPLLKEK
jgi:mannose-6-phosphate isomerase-like protein (cupin superfamily)/ketosteroid isomerase-like protein